MNQWKQKLTGTAFVLLLAGFSFFQAVLPDTDISNTERRHLSKAPAFTAESFLDGTYMQSLETYFLEQFPLRDTFRMVKAEVETNVLGKKDSNDYYQVKDGIYKIDTPLKENNVARAATQFNQLIDDYYPDSSCYYAIIPDKNYFVAKQNGYPAIDYEKVNALMAENLTSAAYIDLYDTLSIEDYYKTDLHWKQESIGEVVNELLSGMDVRDMKTEDASFELATEKFLGGYAGASAFAAAPEEIFYDNSEAIQQMKVYDYEKKDYVSVYAPEKLGQTDDYDFYLWGARALLTIENPTSTSDKNLLIFRDSFGSSIAPILAEHYAEVTLVDLRYVSMTYAMQLLEGKEYQDVLFLYNVSLLNHSDSMKFY